MKSLTTFGLLLLALSVAQTAFADRAVCSKNDSDAFRFAVADLAIMESGAVPLSYGEPEGNVVTIDDVCSKLEDAHIAPSLDRSGYTDVTLRFADTSCTVSLQVTESGKVGDFSSFSCNRN